MNRLKIALAAAAFLLVFPLCACQNMGMGSENGPPQLSSPVQEPLPQEPQEPTNPELPAPNEPTEPQEPEVPASSKPQEPPQEHKARYVRTLVDGLNVRTGAGTGYPSLGQADKGSLLEFNGEENGWYRTRYRGKTAYVSADKKYSELFELAEGNERVENIIEAGLGVLGTPYVYGAVRLHDGRGNLLSGFSVSAFDCSSLMQYMFYIGAGELLDVTTRTQIKQGERVPQEKIMRGDLLFFTNASRCHKTGIERVGHVALYLGENYILHTASDFAKIEQITPQRKDYFLEARRV